MNQMSYILYACFIIIVAASSYSFIKPLATTTFFQTEEQNLFCGTQSMPSNKLSTAYPEGKRLFQQNCQTCHALDKDLTGPSLRGFATRGPWTDKENIYKWINNPAAFINQDQYAKELQKAYNGIIMPAFPALTVSEIDLIVAYLNEF